MIDSFQGEYRFLSNFWPTKVVLDGITFNSVEHAYVASKTNDREIKRLISLLEKPGDAKKIGRSIILRPDFDQIKLSIMYDLVQQKFNVEPLKSKLLSTGDRELIEGNTWGDKFWGVCDNEGLNHLGKILMLVRYELNRKSCVS